MPLEVGAHVGQYTVVGKLGAGGMGVVWRARDTRLDREVALKVLPPGLADDPERHARFEREAKVLASLNHPHIATLYALEHLEVRVDARPSTVDSFPAHPGTSKAEGEAPVPGPGSPVPAVGHAPGAMHVLVMELVEGEDLAALISRGAIPVDEALAIARQIAEALEAAHEHGIVHRDLKPANVKVRPDGAVKVLDFGLAKAFDPAAPGAVSDPARSPTMTHAATQAGLILGTAAYMSPEQARGLAIDRRTDVWSFGVVLYEMLAGTRLFAGELVSDVLANVLKGEIELARLPAATPPAIRRLLRRCLERNPKNRLRDLGEARIAIDEALAGAATGDAAAPAVASAPRRGAALWVAALLVTGAAAALTGYLARPAAPPREPQRLAIVLDTDQEVAVGGDSLMEFSPDGRTLVFCGVSGGRRSLFRRDLAAAKAVQVAGTEDGQSPFISPDGRWIGFAAGGKLMKVEAAGGRPIQLAGAQGAGGATWLADDTIVFAPIYSEGLFRVSADGGEPQRLTTPDHAGGELGHWWPQPLPGERRIVFTAFRTPVDRSRVGVLDLASREVRWVVDGGFFGRYVATGHLLFARGQRLFAVPFDPATATAGGPATAVLDDLQMEQVGGNAALAVSSRGTLAYVTDSLGSPPRELAWLDRSGRAVPAVAEHRRFLSVDLAPDDRRAALTIQGDSTDLWILAFERGTLSRLTGGEKTEFDPVWTAGGDEIVYVVDSPPFELHRIRPGEPDSGRPLWKERARLDTLGTAISPDRRTVAFTLNEPETGTNLYARPLDGSEPSRPLRATRAEETSPAFAPDGRWVAYQSDETGRVEVYVEAFPGPGERHQISADGGREPHWAPTGEIFYRRGDEVRVVATRTAGRFEFDAPRTLFSFSIAAARNAYSRTWDVTRDGQRIVAITTPEATRPRRIEVVTDWTATLGRPAP